ncbi:hypothetical protein AB9F45_39120, partial [Rhizobium leguminosarum]
MEAAARRNEPEEKRLRAEERKGTEQDVQAQNGAAMEAIARQFNIAQEQATKAMAALMPAFSAGLKRST